jgi:hypothetical protein
MAAAHHMTSKSACKQQKDSFSSASIHKNLYHVSRDLHGSLLYYLFQIPNDRFYLLINKFLFYGVKKNHSLNLVILLYIGLMIKEIIAIFVLFEIHLQKFLK